MGGPANSYASRLGLETQIWIKGFIWSSCDKSNSATNLLNSTTATSSEVEFQGDGMALSRFKTRTTKSLKAKPNKLDRQGHIRE